MDSSQQIICRYRINNLDPILFLKFKQLGSSPSTLKQIVTKHIREDFQPTFVSIYVKISC